MSEVIYCPSYNEICSREWCEKHKGKCGWTGYSPSIITTHGKAEELIAQGKAKAYRKSVQRAIALIEKEAEMVKEMGYKLKRL